MDKHEDNVVGTKQEFVEDVPSGDMEVSYEEIKEEGLVQYLKLHLLVAAFIVKALMKKYWKRKYLANHLQY